MPVAERRGNARKKAAKLRKTGRALAPVEIAGRKIAASFWGRSWCSNLESYSDYANRLPRGRTYARNGSIMDLQISAGRIDALVSGSQLYTVTLTIEPLPATRWEAICRESSGEINSLVEILEGKLSKGVMEVVSRRGTGLFPAPREIDLRCSCPDWATMCKHVSAAMYGVGARLDDRPELLFMLRGVDPTDLIATAMEQRVAAPSQARGKVLETEDLGSVFGFDVDFGDDPVVLVPPPTVPLQPPSPQRTQAAADRDPMAEEVLFTLEEEPGLSMRALAEELIIERSQLKPIVRKLKRDGLVRFVGAPATGGYFTTDAA